MTGSIPLPVTHRPGAVSANGVKVIKSLQRDAGLVLRHVVKRPLISPYLQMTAGGKTKRRNKYAFNRKDPASNRTSCTMQIWPLVSSASRQIRAKIYFESALNPPLNQTVVLFGCSKCGIENDDSEYLCRQRSLTIEIPVPSLRETEKRTIELEKITATWAKTLMAALNPPTSSRLEETLELVSSSTRTTRERAPYTAPGFPSVHLIPGNCLLQGAAYTVMWSPFAEVKRRAPGGEDCDVALGVGLGGEGMFDDGLVIQVAVWYSPLFDGSVLYEGACRAKINITRRQTIGGCWFQTSPPRRISTKRPGHSLSE
ncbi:hypothetical protein C8R46DRAFT_1028393 [Mycena filopes]|nr:hypothetical protein C8R46DRAFT_1028393 [Mycena filopes]